ncbi:MAG: NADP-dependent isocitrate dehydrogenase [Firmicutes bacterium]|nr:NADP-dependent isocitrate dehydrogenase [Bacillota bacterium]
MTEKIEMKTPLVEMDGDEMTRVIWRLVKDELILPFINLKTEYYDLGLENRDKTDDGVTFESANAARRLGVAVKCATITPNTERMTEYHLKRLYPSPNATIRAVIGGTVFRAPIIAPGMKRYIPTWKKPIVIARHAYGDVYKNVEAYVPAGGRAELLVTDADGNEKKLPIHSFSGGGVVQGMHNTDESIEGFARSCFEYSLSERLDLWFGVKDTISKTYDRRFRDIFDKIYEDEYKSRFESAGISYFYTLIDDAAARVVRSEGGFVWAMKNYDGDVMSDLLASAYGCLSMMTSVLVSPEGVYEYEAAHGTVQRHFYKYLKGETTSTNPTATIFAWTGALRKRGELDGISELKAWADGIESALLKTIEDGEMTGDLYAVTENPSAVKVSTEEFIRGIRRRYEKSVFCR